MYFALYSPLTFLFLLLFLATICTIWDPDVFCGLWSRINESYVIMIIEHMNTYKRVTSNDSQSLLFFCKYDRWNANENVYSKKWFVFLRLNQTMRKLKIIHLALFLFHIINFGCSSPLSSPLPALSFHRSGYVIHYFDGISKASTTE